MAQEMNLFEEAAIRKIRYQTASGTLGVEDLYDLPLTSNAGKTNLNDIAKVLNRQIQAAQEENFVERSTTNTTLVISFEIVKAVIAWRQEQNAQQRDARARAERKARIRDIIANKQDQELSEMSIEDLEKEYAEL